MKGIVYVVWFVAFFVMLATVENLNGLFAMSFAIWAFASYLVSYDERFKIEKDGKEKDSTNEVL